MASEFEVSNVYDDWEAMTPVCSVWALMAALCFGPSADSSGIPTLHSPAPVLAAESLDLPLPRAGRRHSLRDGILASTVIGVGAGLGACATVDRMRELPWYGCALLGVGHGVPIGVAVPLALGRSERSALGSFFIGGALGGAVGGAYALSYANGDAAIFALPPASAVVGALVALIAR